MVKGGEREESKDKECSDRWEGRGRIVKVEEEVEEKSRSGGKETWVRVGYG